MEHCYWISLDECVSFDKMKAAVDVMVEAWIIHLAVAVPAKGNYVDSGLLVRDHEEVDNEHIEPYVPDDNDEFSERLTEWTNTFIEMLISGTKDHKTWDDLDIWRDPPPDEDDDEGGDDGELQRMIYWQAVSQFALCDCAELTALAAFGEPMVERMAAEALLLKKKSGKLKP